MRGESRWRSISIMDLNLTKRRSMGVTNPSASNHHLLTSTNSASLMSSASSSSGFMRNNKQQGNTLLSVSRNSEYGLSSTFIAQPTATIAHNSSSSAAGGGPPYAIPLSAAGHSYELIKSTQSLVDRLQLNAGDITIQPVHPSIIGQDTWFQITYNSSRTTRYFSCQNTKERDEWIASLKNTLALNEDRRRTDNRLKIGVLEIKGLRDKKKYFVEVLIDDKLYARTSAKKMGDNMCFWGEYFEFKDLPERTEYVSLLIHKERSGNGAFGSRNKKAKKPVGRVRISIKSITSRYSQEKWHGVEKSSRRETPSIRLKCQYQSIDILPLNMYEPFLYFLKSEYKDLVKLFEPNISVKVKDELALSLMAVFQCEDIAEDVLAEIVVEEISANENDSLTFRANTVATKAMESYIKLVGQKYLQSTLQSVITEILNSDLDLEVDPNKVSQSFNAGGNPNSPANLAASAEALTKHRENLRTAVNQVWSRISKSYSYFPVQLQRCFHKIRQFLEHFGKPSEVGDTLISSCIFLRYLCPAILSPSLFNMTDQFPSERANRNLTLIAKTLQTLANFLSYKEKEPAMEFMNGFLEQERDSMRAFLRQISSPIPPDAWIPDLNMGSAAPSEKLELGKNLSCLHTIMLENISRIPEDHPKTAKLRELLDELNVMLKRPSIDYLKQISACSTTSTSSMSGLPGAQITSASASGTPKTGVKTVNNTNGASSTASSIWGALTLPKRPKSNIHTTTQSHPAPHHQISSTTVGTNGRPFFKTTTAVNVTVPGGQAPLASKIPDFSDTTTSSSSVTSLTPSPHNSYGGGPTVTVGGGIRRDFPLDDMTDSSDDSTYSSQYCSDTTSTPINYPSSTTSRTLANHHRHLNGSSTLPRPPASSKNLRNSHPNEPNIVSLSSSTVAEKTLTDYETEILDLRTAMESLQLKLFETEQKLQEREEASGLVNQLERDEEKLRRMENVAVVTVGADPSTSSSPSSTEKESMIRMQQRKIAALDEANVKLVKELRRLGDKLKVVNDAKANHIISQSNNNKTIKDGEPNKMSKTDEKETEDSTPRSVDELLDSLHSTPI